MARIKFTDKWVSSCSLPAEGRVEHSDAICPGLYMRVSSRGVRTFTLIVRRGKLIRRTLGRYPVLTLAAARQTAMALMREMEEADAQDVATPTITLAELINAYSQTHLPGLRSAAGIKAILMQSALADLRARPAASIERREVIAVLDEIVATGRGHAAVNLLKNLRAMYNWGMDRDLVAANPCDRIRPPVRTTQRDRILTDREITSVLQACGRVPAPFGDLVRVLLHTGSRRNEAAQMRWSELDGAAWTLPAARSKNGRPNLLPLPPAVMSIVTSQQKHGEDGFVFTTTGGARPSSNFSKNLRALHEASGTSGWTLHDLRRTARTKLSQLGVSRDVARRVVGHSGDMLDATYDHYSFAREKGDALRKLAVHLAELNMPDAGDQ